MEDDATLPPQAVEATLPATGGPASSGLEATMAPAGVAAGSPASSSSSPPASLGPIIRVGRTGDYRELIAVDPAHYIVGAEIARGGMGRILEARDRRLGRPVAIKELLHASPDARARFEREARITARLQHPAIVNILEAGSWPGAEPFYVMKLVTGESLDQVIAKRRELAERLALVPNVIAAVDALAYAHAHQVIHRDLKPANVLVGAFGETVVIDWGLAKDLADATDVAVPVGPYRDRGRAAGETVVGSVMGTPAYMPAEQARGEIVDARSDVYSLGAMLYHVLAGVPPYTGATTDAVLDRVIEGPPVPLAERVPGIPPDLITIVEKAMAHDAADRYATAAELAGDLKRFQTGQLVGAHRYSTWALVRRWIRRNRAAVTVAAVLVTLLATVAVISVSRIVDERNEANRQRVAADQARAEAEARRTEADSRRIGAEKILSFMIGDLQAKLTSLGKLELLSGLGRVMLDYYETVGDDAATTPTDLAGRARAFGTLARVEGKKGNAQDALELWQRSLDTFTALATRDAANPEWWYGKAASWQALATAYRNRGDTAKIDGAQAEALAAGRKAYQLAPTDQVYRRAFAVALATTADNKSQAGDATAGLAMLREAEPLFLAATKDASEANLISAFEDHLTIKAMIVDAMGKRTGSGDALAEAQAGVAYVDELQARYPDAVELPLRATSLYLGLADLEFDSGRNEAALGHYRQGLEAAERVLRIDPAQKYGFENYYFLHSRIAATLHRLGKAAEATAAYDAAIRLDEDRAAHDPTDNVAAIEVAIALQGAAEVAAARKAFAAAAAYSTRAITIVEKVLATTKDTGRAEWTSSLAADYLARALARVELGDRARAAEDLRRAEALSREVAKAVPDEHSAVNDLPGALIRVANARVSLGEVAAARALLDEALAAADAATATSDSSVLEVDLINGLAARAALPDSTAAAALADRTRALGIIDALAARGPLDTQLSAMQATLRQAVGRADP